MSMEVIAKLNDLVPDSGCMYAAIEPILETCDEPEDVFQRTHLAVQLALCEFAATGIAFPEVCRDPTRLLDCTGELESKATWWTTFSGQYRHISVICREFQPHYESQKVLNVFRRANDVYSDYESSLKTQMANLRYAAEQTSNILQLVQNKLRNELELLSQHALDSNAEIERLYSALHEIQLSTQSFSNQFGQFTESMTSVRLQHESTSHALEVSANRTITVLQSADATLAETTNLLKGLATLFRVFGAFMGLPGLLLLIVVLVFWRRRSDHDLDVLFY